MKKCYTCQTFKDANQFSKNKSKNDGLNTICKECSKNRSKKYYSDNTEHHKRVIKKRKDENDDFVRFKILEFLKKNPCIICGETNLMVLDFDHLGNKTKNVCDFIQNNSSWEIVKKEIDKCQVLCSNCHRIKTHTDLKSYKWKAMQGI